MLGKLLAAAILTFGMTAHANADEPIGGSLYQNTSATGTVTIISAATNVNGAHIRSIVMACGGNSGVASTPPGTGALPMTIMLCNPTSPGQGVAMLPNSMYLPPGYSLFYQGTGTSEIYMTYNLN